MSLPSNITYHIGSEIYVEEPKLDAIVAAVQAKCVAAGHSEWLPSVITRTIDAVTYMDKPKLAHLQQALINLGATGPTYPSLTIGGTIEQQKWTLEDILTAARSIGA
jgi:hypothetical protein